MHLHAMWQVHLQGPMTHSVWWGRWRPRERGYLGS